MNFKIKLAAVAALSALMAAPAFAVTDYDFSANAAAADVNALAVTEFTTLGTLAGDGNVAFINQESSSNLAAIDQTGATNFAAIQQATNDVNLAVIYQVGDSNRANIYQH